MAHVPLEDETLDVAIFSLSLMGANFADYVREAYRTLKLDGHLHIHYWDGVQWRWTDHGTPGNTTVFDTPAVVTWQDSGTWVIYSFVRGRNGNLFAYYWDGGQWRWEDTGAPANNVKLGGSPAATPRAEIISTPNLITRTQQVVQAFARGDDGHLYMVALNLSLIGHKLTRKWVWSDLGTPQSTKVSATPGVITYPEDNTQRTYVFVRGYDSQLHVCYWTGQWQWAVQGKPYGAAVVDAPGVTTYLESGRQWIYAVVRGDDNVYHANYWNGWQWNWATLPCP